MCLYSSVVAVAEPADRDRNETKKREKPKKNLKKKEISKDLTKI